MANSKLTFNVTGRYMDGTKVIGYQLVGSDGSQLQVNNERIIFMIGRGEVANMRIQYSNGNVVPRGKGVNLLKLPAFDVNKNDFRNNKTASGNSTGAMGQQEIVARIMRGKRVEGYVLRDYSGAEKKLPRNKVIELASNKIISNATVSKYNPYRGMTLEQAKQAPRFKQEEWDYIQKFGYITRLNGVGVQLDTLPVLIILDDGQIVDPKDVTYYNKMTMRAFRTPRGGTIYCDNKHMTFRQGDWIVVKPDGCLTAVGAQEFGQKCKFVRGQNKATCDEFLGNLDKFDIELFGTRKQKLQPNAVKGWNIVQMVK